MKNIRNFSIIAHIDHGKSTIADRFIQYCKGLSNYAIMNNHQILDSMDIERERGITIKAQSVTLNYNAQDGNLYKLNLIDTPGHVDFSYEVSRSLAACEGVLLVVDATQGVEAQTISNYHAAFNQKLEIIVVINKIDLPMADTRRVYKEIKDVIDVPNFCIIECSAKTGYGIVQILENIVKNIPHPTAVIDSALQALIIDSWFDAYLGVVSLVRIFNGMINVNDKIKIMSTGEFYRVNKLGIFTPNMHYVDSLNSGEVGFVIAGIRNINGAPVGDTITLCNNPSFLPIHGFNKVQPQVYAGIFPINSDNFHIFRSALLKLSLNDSSLCFEPEVSQSLGAGFRCGFLGLLHMEIVQERLEREYNLNLIRLAPTVFYKIQLKNGKEIKINNAINFPKSISVIKDILEPIYRVYILISESKFIGSIIKLCTLKRGVQYNINYTNTQISIIYDIPVIEFISDFVDKLKSVTHGYSSLNYIFLGYKSSNMILLEVLINSLKVDSLSRIVHKQLAYNQALILSENLKKVIPKQMFDVIIQIVLRGKVVAKSKIRALKKNVLNKCLGGKDISRKRKLLDKQKLGKKRMKKIGNIDLPQDAFLI